MWYIVPYSDIFRTLCNLHLYKSSIFRTLAYLESKHVKFWICKTIRNIQSPGVARIVHSSNFKEIYWCSGNLVHVESHSSITFFTRRSILNVCSVLNTSFSRWLFCNFYSDLMLSASVTFRILTYLQLCLFKYIQAYWSMFCQKIKKLLNHI